MIKKRNRLEGFHHTQKSHLLLVPIMLLLLLCLPTSVQAMTGKEEAVNQLPSGIVIGDDKGIKVDKDGKYLMEVNDVAPGKRWKTEVTMLNVEKDDAYELSMLVYPPTLSGPIDFSQAITMTLSYNGKEIYKGPLSGISKTVTLQDPKNPLDLGTIKSGDSQALTVELAMSGDYSVNDFMEKSVMENVWEFKATKTKKPTPEEPTPENPVPTPPKKPGLGGLLPQTGEEWRMALISVCLGLFIILMIILILKKKRENEQAT